VDCIGKGKLNAQYRKSLSVQQSEFFSIFAIFNNLPVLKQDAWVAPRTCDDLAAKSDSSTCECPYAPESGLDPRGTQVSKARKIIIPW